MQFLYLTSVIYTLSHWSHPDIFEGLTVVVRATSMACGDLSNLLLLAVQYAVQQN